MKNTKPLHHYLSQLHSLSQQVQQIQQSKQYRERPCNASGRAPETRTCFNCRKPGHIARNCRSNRPRFNQYAQNRQRHPLTAIEISTKYHHTNIRETTTMMSKLTSQTMVGNEDHSRTDNNNSISI